MRDASHPLRARYLRSQNTSFENEINAKARLAPASKHKVVRLEEGASLALSHDFSLLKRERFRHDDDAFGRNGEAFAIFFQIVADGGACRDFHVFVDDGAADFAMPSDFDIVEQNRVFNRRPRMQEGARADDRAFDARAGNDGSGR